MSWQVTANDIKNWSNTHSREAQGLLPLLIKKLILATVNPSYINFPSGDSVLTGGWDGILEVSKGNIFVPDGKSYWEFGTNKSTHQKANNDYDKRTQQEANNTIHYCFATTQTWSKKTEFEKEKNAQSRWKSVRGINADDLETWLEIAPAVHRWFAKLIGKRPDNAIDIDEAFEQWSNQTQIRLSPKLVTLSREEEQRNLIQSLNGNASKIIIISQSEEESFAFILATLKDEDLHKNRVLIVKSQNEWDTLIQSQESLILIYQSFTPNNIGQAINNSHFVIEAQENLSIKDEAHESINLSKVSKEQKSLVLEEMGIDREKTEKILNDTKGFLHAIKQHPSLKPLEKSLPSWVDNYNMDVLISILFINSWKQTNKYDIKLFEALSNSSYEIFEQELHKLRQEKETPIRLVGDVWQVISKINLFDLIAKNITLSHIQKLLDVSLEVFSEIDPTFEVVPKDRWMAYDKQLNYSGLLRESLADSLVLLSVFGEKKITNIDINRYISNTLDTLYNKNLHLKSWYSYGSQLSILTEANPNSFLNAFEKALKDKETQIDKLFESSDDIFGSCNHCNLLWALERISWNSDYTPRVVLILAQLSHFEIQSNLSNKPFNSLKDIFLGWINYSSLTYQEKIQILEYILLKKEPQITWNLLLELLPNNHSMSSGIARPKYNTWDEKLPKQILEIDFHNYNSEINRLLFENIDNEAERWRELLANIDKFNETYYFQIINTFCSLNKSIFTEKERLNFTDILRDKIHNYRKYDNSPNWALSSEWIDQLERTFYFIKPNSVVYQYKYLFDDWEPNILYPTPYVQGESSYKDDEQNFTTLRKEALETIIKQKELQGLQDLIHIVKLAHFIPFAFSELKIHKFDAEIFTWLKEEEKLQSFALNYIQILYINGKTTLNSQFLESYTDMQKAKILLSLPFESKIFEFLKQQNRTIQEYYWKNNNRYFFHDDKDLHYCEWIVTQLSIYKRPMKAIDFFASFLITKKQNIPIDFDLNLLYEILIQTATEDNGEKLKHYDIVEVLEYYQKYSSDKNKKIYLESLYAGFDEFEAITIESEIIENPKFFVDLVTYIYKPKHSQREDEGLTQEQLTNRAEVVWKLLRKISLFAEHIKSKSLDSSYLKEWISKAQYLLKEADRESIGNNEIAQALAKSPIGDDEVWPHEVIREVLEEFADEKIGNDFLIGKQNLRGVHWINSENEYKIARQYLEDAEKIKFFYPKTSNLLKELSKRYQEDGKRYELEDELK